MEEYRILDFRLSILQKYVVISHDLSQLRKENGECTSYGMCECFVYIKEKKTFLLFRYIYIWKYFVYIIDTCKYFVSTKTTTTWNK